MRFWISFAISSRRCVIVDHHVHLENIDCSRNDLCGDEHVERSISGHINDGGLLASLLVPVENSDLAALLHHPLCNHIHRVASLLGKNDHQAEDGDTQTHLAGDDTLPDGHALIELGQDIVFVLCVLALHAELLVPFN